MSPGPFSDKSFGAKLPRHPRPRRAHLLLWLAVALAVVLYGFSSTVSYYVEALWFTSLGYARVFWTRIDLEFAVFGAFAVATFAALYGAYRALAPPRLDELVEGTILVNRQRLTIPIGPLLNLAALIAALAIAVEVGVSMATQWSSFALWWFGPQGGLPLDPIFQRPLGFYLFTLPVWELIVGWLLMLAIIACILAAAFLGLTAAARMLPVRRSLADQTTAWRRLSAALAILLLVLAAKAYLARFERLFAEGTIFSGVSYTDAHVMLGGLMVVCFALLAGAIYAAICVVRLPDPRWLVSSIVPAVVCWLAVEAIAAYVSGFIVKPNQLERERPFIAHNIQMTRAAYALDRIERHPFPADAGLKAVEAPENQTTLENIRLWDWRALQDTLRQIQEIRTYYDFPDIDIDRYRLGGRVRQMMLAARELDIEKLPPSSRNWINEKLIYTHGYGVTMNPVNGFTPEGLPELVLANMPVESSIPGLAVTRPEIYFGESTDTDVYVDTRQKEFNYPQGDTNNLTTYAGSGGIRLGGLLRRVLIAYDRGDITKIPFNDDVGPNSRLLMRRQIRSRVRELAPFLTLDPDPYLVVSSSGRLYWIIDAYTTSDTYPYSTRYALGDGELNYIRNSVKVVIDAYNGTTTFYVFDPADPIIRAYRSAFPSLFKDAAAMPSDLRAHVRYPELLLSVQGYVYGLYHMTDPDVFYNREDLWTIASEIGSGDSGQQIMDPNYVLMTLPGESTPEFIAILPFTPANRNNLIGWIAGRSDGAHYGEAVAYDFPKTKLVDGPLQIEARIDQNAQLSGQLSLWNQQGSHVRRGDLIVIPIGQALLYAEPIYLQAARSPMPELRLVVLALQDRLAYGPTFETAMAALFGGAPSTLSVQARAAGGPQQTGAPAPGAAASLPGSGAAQPAAGPSARKTAALIHDAAQDLEDYQRLTAAGKLGAAGEKLDALKAKLEDLQRGHR
ncbi:MAG: UPF0182 family protein [Steroidobacteraceae bacterium]